MLYYAAALIRVYTQPRPQRIFSSPSFIVWLLLPLEILGNISIAIVC